MTVSDKNVHDKILSKYDKAAASYAKKNLSLFQYLRWKFTSGRAFWAYHISSVMTLVNVVVAGFVTFGVKPTLAFLSKTFPILATLMAKLWSVLKSLFTSVTALVTLGS